MKKGILSLLTLIFILSVLSSMSFASTLPDKEQVRYDKLLALSPSVFAASNYFAAVETTCTSGSNTPKFKPGQVVSSDVFNEIFSRIDNITEGFGSSSEIIGTWSCTVNAIIGAGYDYCLSTGFYTRDPSNFFDTMTDIVTFKDNSDGSYSYAMAKYPLILCVRTVGNTTVPAIAAPETGKFLIVRNHMMLKPDIGPNWSDPYQGYPIQSFMPMLKKSKYSFVVDSIVYGRLITCDRQDIPPSDPMDLSATVSGMNVTLVWKNICNSTATSVKVLRKDSLTGNYSAVATLSAIETSYSETVPNAGTYWYRIVATNAYGDSTGSNVADVTAK